MHHNNFGNFYTRQIYAIPIPIGFSPIPIMSRMAIPIPMGFPWEWDSHGVSHSHTHLYCPVRCTSSQFGGGTLCRQFLLSQWRYAVQCAFVRSQKYQICMSSSKCTKTHFRSRLHLEPRCTTLADLLVGWGGNNPVLHFPFPSRFWRLDSTLSTHRRRNRGAEGHGPRNFPLTGALLLQPPPPTAAWCNSKIKQLQHIHKSHATFYMRKLYLMAAPSLIQQKFNEKKLT